MKRSNSGKAVVGVTAAALIAGLWAAPALAHRRVVVHRHRPAVRVVVSAPRPVTKVVVVGGRPAAVVDFNVKPGKTGIWIDGTYRGICDQFDGFPQKMYLKPGRHKIRLLSPAGVEVEREMVLTGGYEVNLNLDLR